MAYEQWQQTPQGIESMFNANVSNGGGTIAATPSLMQLLGQQQAADVLTSKDQQRQYDYNMAADPLKLQGLDLANQTTQAELPGRKATSISQGVKANIDLNTMQSVIDRALAENGAKKTASHAEELGSIGTILMQHAAGIGNNPVGAGARTRALFKNLGIESMLNPNFDQMDPINQIESIRDLGGNMMDASAKARMAVQKYEMQGQTQRAVAETKARSAKEVADIKKAASDFVANTRAAISKDHQKLQEAAVQEQELAQQAADKGDSDGAAMHMARANEFFARAVAAAQAPAQVNTATKVDLPSLAEGKLAPRGPQPAAPVAPNTTGAVPGAGAGRGIVNPQPAATRIPGVPEGRIPIFQNGKPIGHIPIEQAEDALKQGYTLQP